MRAARARALLAAAIVALLAEPARADDATTERQRLASQRAAIESRYRAEESACRERFVVTPCLEAARAERRQALSSVRERELKLDDVERRERARVRREAIAVKRAQAAAQAASAASAPSVPASGGGRPSRPAPVASSAALAAPAVSRAPLDADGATAAARVARSAERRQQAADRKARIEQRQREHAARTQGGVKGAPLPAASAASR